MKPHLRLLFFAAVLASCKPSPQQGAQIVEAAAPRTIADAPRPPTPITPAVAPTVTQAVSGASPVAFPGAEGFGANARGGRGGAICRVSTLAKDGKGSLQECLDRSGPRTVVFDVSGVIDGPLEIKHGRLTIAGQTSPAGIIVKGGMVCDNVYDPNDCNDVIVRHVRFRKGEPDAFRVGGAHDVILDHCSFAQADDENIEITRSRNVTVQWSVVAEPLGDHYRWGGVLINYSKDVMPLDAITLHHNVWNGVAGRLPEITCEENGDGPGKSNCRGHVARVEITNNVMWDASDPIWFNRCTSNNEGNECAPSPADFRLALNLTGNVFARRSSADPDAPFIEPNAWKGEVFAERNLVLRGTTPVKVPAGRPVRHAFPQVTTTPEGELVATLSKRAGAFPRDAMDARLARYLELPVDQRPRANDGKVGLDQKDALAGRTIGVAPADTDGDGMPDAWEAAHGSDPRVADGAIVRGCAGGYTALECYLAELSDVRLRSP